jgi:hypothetical protein
MAVFRNQSTYEMETAVRKRGPTVHRRAGAQADPTSRLIPSFGYSPPAPSATRTGRFVVGVSKPVENCYIESLNGRLRDECLNTNVFTSLEDAKRKLLEWKIDYNEQRPHGSLGDLTPMEFAKRHQGKQAAWPGIPQPRFGLAHGVRS